jgi:hypothetical protein
MGWNDNYCPSSYTPSPAGMRALANQTRRLDILTTREEEESLMEVFRDEIIAEAKGKDSE